jgi:hypothetical protein
MPPALKACRTDRAISPRNVPPPQMGASIAHHVPTRSVVRGLPRRPHGFAIPSPDRSRFFPFATRWPNARRAPRPTRNRVSDWSGGCDRQRRPRRTAKDRDAGRDDRLGDRAAEKGSAGVVRLLSRTGTRSCNQADNGHRLASPRSSQHTRRAGLTPPHSPRRTPTARKSHPHAPRHPRSQRARPLRTIPTVGCVLARTKHP